MPLYKEGTERSQYPSQPGLIKSFYRVEVNLKIFK